MHQIIKNLLWRGQSGDPHNPENLEVGEGVGGDQRCIFFVSTGKFFTMLTYSFWILAVFFVRRHISTDIEKNKAVFFRSESDMS